MIHSNPIAKESVRSLVGDEGYEDPFRQEARLIQIGGESVNVEKRNSSLQQQSRAAHHQRQSATTGSIAPNVPEKGEELHPLLVNGRFSTYNESRFYHLGQSYVMHKNMTLKKELIQGMCSLLLCFLSQSSSSA